MSAVEVFLIRHAAAIDETLELRDPHAPPHRAGPRRRRRASAIGCAGTTATRRTSGRARSCARVQTAELVARGARLPSHRSTCCPRSRPASSPRAVHAALSALPRRRARDARRSRARACRARRVARRRRLRALAQGRGRAHHRRQAALALRVGRRGARRCVRGRAAPECRACARSRGCRTRARGSRS